MTIILNVISYVIAAVIVGWLAWVVVMIGKIVTDNSLN